MFKRTHLHPNDEWILDVDWALFVALNVNTMLLSVLIEMKCSYSANIQNSPSIKCYINGCIEVYENT